MDSIFGYYVSYEHRYDFTSEEEEKYNAKSKTVNDIVWGEAGIKKKTADILTRDYGTDIDLILFEIYVTPNDDVIDLLSRVHKYKKKEKAFGLPIIVNEVEFRLAKGRLQKLLENKLLEELDKIQPYIKQKAMKIDVEKLTNDLRQSLRG
jgi:hypothetical protein